MPGNNSDIAQNIHACLRGSTLDPYMMRTSALARARRGTPHNYYGENEQSKPTKR